MFHNRGKLLSGVALVFGIQVAFAEEAWLVIVSDPPGVAVSVDGTYRGTTPQRPGDALRIQVSEGVREVDARLRLDGKEYAARQVVEAWVDRENPVQINLRQETARALIIPTTPPVQARNPRFGMRVPLDDLEVPGRNF